MSSEESCGGVADRQRRTAKAKKETLFFVNVNENEASEASKASNRKKARSHVMSQYHRKYRKQQKASPTRQDTPSNATPESSSSSQAALRPTTKNGQLPEISNISVALQQQFCLYGWNNAIFKPYLSKSLSPHDFDLVRLPIQLHERDEMLLHHYGKIVNYSNITLNPKKDWIHVLANDTAVVYATLLLSALHLALLLKKKKSIDALRHQTKLTKVLNHRFNEPTDSQTDGTILTIACIALMDVLNNVPQSAEPHIKALQHLIDCRGGLDSLGFGGLVRRKVLWADLSSSIAQQIAPRFPYTPIALDIFVSSIDVSDTELYKESSRLIVELNVTSNLCHILGRLQDISAFIAQTNRSQASELDSVALSDYIYDCERRAYDDYLQCRDKIFNSHDLKELSTEGALQLACCLASLMYSIFAIRELPIQAEFFTPFVSSFLLLLDQIDFCQAGHTYPLTAQWILATAGILSYERTERQLYIRLFADLCQQQGSGSWDIIKKNFLDRIYVTQLYAAEFRDFWNDIEEQWILEGLS